MNNELRWKQRFSNFQKAFSVFERRVNEYRSQPADEANQMSLVQAFEIIIELSWKTMKDYLENQGYSDLNNPKAVIRQAFQGKLIADTELWLRATDIRNETSHVYHLDVLNKVIAFIEKEFSSILQDLHKQLQKLL